MRLICQQGELVPHVLPGMRWWRADQWEEVYRAYEGMWPDIEPWSKEDWQMIHDQGYRYCALLVDGRAVSTAGLWKRTDDQWEVIGVGTAPDHRCKGYAKAVVSFITEEILKNGPAATITTDDANIPMQSVAKALGYREMAEEEEAGG